MTILALNMALAMSIGAAPAEAAVQSHQSREAAPAAASADESTNMQCSRVQTGFEPFDFDAREEQVASGDQRIAPLAPEQLTDEARDIAASLLAFFGSKEEGVSKTFATMAKHPGLYRGQMQLGLELNRNGKLPPREREMVILRTAWLVRSPFVWGQHVEYGKKYGLSGEEIERITQGSCAPGWSDHDRAVLRGVEELIGDYAVSDETWDNLARSWNEQQLMELPGLVGSYMLTAMLYNTLRFGLLEGNDGFRDR